ncbi:MAG: branched-chain amino acid aminotransferase [Actinomycetaceae bacterium]|nr:branched-chain amino acid aminotransferase [Actinomycetaceae bacterium]
MTGEYPLTALENAAQHPLAASNELASRFHLTPNPSPASDADYSEVMTQLAFGKAFTDHMAHIVWTPDQGWHDHEVIPFGDLTISPAASVFHYGQELFEGIKAYRHADGSVWTFRPTFNAARFNHSARRMAMPELPIDDFVGSIAAYVGQDEKWVPTKEGASLYLRPFMIATEPFLGVRSAHRFDYYLIGAPSGAYFSGGPKGVAIEVVKGYHRAGPGGTGSAKVGGNYAASLLPQAEAAGRGFDQICFLDAREEKWVEELGGMNVFIVRADGDVYTPALTGTILEGSTRSSITRLLRDGGTAVHEDHIAIADLIADIESGAVKEVFACGTAAVVTPITRLAGDGFDVHLPVGEVTLGIHSALTSIQTGEADDPYGWMYRLV